MATHVRLPRDLSQGPATPPALPGWARRRIGIAASVLAVGVALGVWVLGSPELGGAALWVVVVACLVTAGVTVLGTTVAVVRLVLCGQEQELAALHVRVRDAEAGRRADRVLLHEVRTAVAGIASAHKLLAVLPASDRREGLTSMVDAELDRLQRRLDPHPEGAGRPAEVALDDVVGRIVLAHRAQGRGVTWEPGTQPAAQLPGRDADDLARILDILLENAAQHGCPDSVEVTVHVAAQAVDLVVGDQGPGVPDELRDRIFDWGVRRPRSPGQGIGLHTATGLARDLGGELRIDPGSGARFVLHVPLTRPMEQSRGALLTPA